MDDLPEIEDLVQDVSFIGYCLHGTDQEKWCRLEGMSSEHASTMKEASAIVTALYRFGMHQALAENEKLLRQRIQLDSQEDNVFEQSKTRRSWPYWIAASIILVIGAIVFTWTLKKEPPPVNYVVVKTRPGEQKKIVFSDSTVIWMDGNSEIKYLKADDFDRKLLLSEGQIACLVKHDTLKEFVITTASGLKVKDLGTLFSIYSKSGIDKEHVRVLEGELKVSFKTQSSILRKNVSWSISHKTEEQSGELCDENQLAWRDGFYVYKNIPLNEYISNLQDAFNVHIVMDDKRYRYMKVSSSFHNTDNVADILTGLEAVYGLTFRQIDKTSFTLL